MIWETVEEINFHLALRLKNIRKQKKYSQEHLSKISGVSFGSIKRFETKGDISLLSLTKICVALNCVDEIKNLFLVKKYNSIEEIINEK